MDSRVFSIGESLIDFVPAGTGALSFTAKAGGAPSNVSACVSKLGGKGYYLGKLGTDVFSRFLLATMQKYGVNTDYTIIDARYQTALAFVTLNERGDREFNFYRKESCDLMLDSTEIPADLFTPNDILHFCSVGLVESPSKYAHKRALELADQNGAMISFDVNVRENLWDNVDNCVKTIWEFLPYPDVIKVTDDEVRLITKMDNEKEAVAKMFETAKKCKIMLVTRGPEGVIVYDRELNSFYREAVDVPVVDTTGAGDCFIGSLLYLISKGEAKLTLEGIREGVDFASYGCGIVIGSKGAIESMPTQEDIADLKTRY
ncbi:MAG: carbohydrate kinase [Bacillota bacterium]